MKARIRSLTYYFTAVVCVVAGIGCNQSERPESAPPAPEQRTDARAAAGGTFTSAESNSFAAVTAQLDPGGSFYAYLGTEQWLGGLSAKLDEFKKMFASLPEMGGAEQAGIQTGFDVLGRLVSASGLEQVSGVGISSIAREPGLYRTRVVVHHYPGNQKGFIWSIAGTEPHALDMLELLPATTALALSSDFNLSLLWQIVEGELKAANVKPALEAFDQLRQMIKSKYNMDWEQLLSSTPGPFVVMLLLDETRTFAVPTPGASLNIPHPGLVILARVKDEKIYDLVEQSLPPEAGVIKTNRAGLKMQSMPLPVGLPFSPTVAQAGDYLMLASHPRHVEEVLSAKNGSATGLKSTAEFKRLSTDIDLTGNQFSFVSERFGRAVNQAVKTALQGMTNEPSAPPMEFVQSMLGTEKVTFAVGSNTREGWVITANGNQHPGSLAVAPLLIAPTAILSSLLLPALSKAKDRATSISCVNNMKQICLGALMYANDHNDTFPPNFIAMTEELATPRVLICPQDPRREQVLADDWARLDPANITYEFVSPGTQAGGSQKILIRCRVHGHVGMTDGSVRASNTR